MKNSARGDEAENRAITESFSGENLSGKNRELAYDRLGWPDNIWIPSGKPCCPEFGLGQLSPVTLSQWQARERAVAVAYPSGCFLREGGLAPCTPQPPAVTSMNHSHPTSVPLHEASTVHLHLPSSFKAQPRHVLREAFREEPRLPRSQHLSNYMESSSLDCELLEGRDCVLFCHLQGPWTCTKSVQRKDSHC